MLLAGLVVLLVAGSMGVLLTEKQASDRAAALQVASAHATQTAVAQIVHFPYHAAAPGPVCDKGNAPWMLADFTTQKDLTCTPTHTRFSGLNVGVKWLGNPDENSMLPQSYTVSVQVSNLHAAGGVPMAVSLEVETAIGPSFIVYNSSGETDGTMCPGRTCISGPYLTPYYDFHPARAFVSPSGTHTLSITVKGARISMAVDSHTFASVTQPGPVQSQAIALIAAYDGGDYVTSSLSADFANFTVE